MDDLRNLIPALAVTRSCRTVQLRDSVVENLWKQSCLPADIPPCSNSCDPIKKLPGNSFLPMAIPTLAPWPGSHLSPLVSAGIFWNGACNIHGQTKWRAIGTL